MTSTNNLRQKRVLLGVTGGIAAYKSAELVRRLQDEGADVRIIMTKSATEFVKPLTFQALSSYPIHTELLDPSAEAAMGHIELARWADVFVIAPASANTIAKLMHGEADDLLSTVVLACRAPLVVVPAMNQAMWANAATQANMKILQDRQINILGPDSGVQACGDIGEGRMLSVPDIVTQLNDTFSNKALSGKHVVITAGPTREAIDPVRYISNHSSGKMGYALAQAALEAGAAVSLISGPTQLTPPERATTVNVKSALDMHAATSEACKDADIFIACAAVADYRPADIAESKIKKNDDTMSISLVKNPDILADISINKTSLFTVGFAAETNDMIKHATGKLERKNLNMIIANKVGSGLATGFNSDENAAEVLYQTGSEVTQTSFPQNSKSLLAKQLISFIADKVSA